MNIYTLSPGATILDADTNTRVRFDGPLQAQLRIRISSVTGVWAQKAQLTSGDDITLPGMDGATPIRVQTSGPCSLQVVARPQPKNPSTSSPGWALSLQAPTPTAPSLAPPAYSAEVFIQRRQKPRVLNKPMFPEEYSHERPNGPHSQFIMASVFGDPKMHHSAVETIVRCMLGEQPEWKWLDWYQYADCNASTLEAMLQHLLELGALYEHHDSELQCG